MSDTVEVKPLQKALQLYNEDLSTYLNNEERFKLGRVLTIIDASIADPEQRKAIKDLINNEWWGNSMARPSECLMQNPHRDLSSLCEALGFDLYAPSSAGEDPVPSSDNSWIVKRYKKVATEE